MPAVGLLQEPRLLFGRVVVPKTRRLCFGDKFYVINKDERLEYGPGRIWGPSEVMNAWQASVLRQNRHYAGCGKERLGVYTDSTGFVPQDVDHSLHSDAFCKEKKKRQKERSYNSGRLLTKIHSFLFHFSNGTLEWIAGNINCPATDYISQLPLWLRVTT